MPNPGETLNNRYRIVAHLKAGGMGTVYRAWDLNLRTPCAVKQNASTTNESTNQFMREAHMLAALNHPNLPRVYDHFTLPGSQQYLVMDFIEGQDLQAVIDAQGAMIEAHAVGFVVQVCDALAYMHSRPEPIIHRDIKPANIRITPDGRAVLVDFGIAKQVSGPDGTTTRGARAVTPGYSPVEQYGYGSTTAQTDIYALGATLLALLTGATPTEATQRYSGQTLTVPPNVSPHVGAAILRAMALNADARFASADAFKQALLTQGRSALDDTVRLDDKPPRRFPYLWAGLGALALLLAVGYFLFTNGVLGAAPPPTATVPFVTNAPATATDAAATQEVAIATSGNSDSNGLPTILKTDTPPPTDIPPPTPEPTLTPTPPPTDTPTPVPGLLEIGRSANGTPLDAYRIGTGSSAVVLVGGLLSGHSPSGVEVTNRALAWFQADPGRVPAGVSLYIIPNINPDAPYAPGDARGRLNGNGVDLNRNWGCNWQQYSEASGETVYGGEQAFSEPETRALRDLILNVNARAVIFYSARATDGRIYLSVCNGRYGGSDTLQSVYRAASGYGNAPTAMMGIGEAGDWLVTQDIPSIFVLFDSHTSLPSGEWERNRAGILAVLERYGQ